MGTLPFPPFTVSDASGGRRYGSVTWTALDKTGEKKEREFFFFFFFFFPFPFSPSFISGQARSGSYAGTEERGCKDVRIMKGGSRRFLFFLSSSPLLSLLFLFVCGHRDCARARTPIKKEG